MPLLKQPVLRSLLWRLSESKGHDLEIKATEVNTVIGGCFCCTCTWSVLWVYCLQWKLQTWCYWAVKNHPGQNALQSICECCRWPHLFSLKRDDCEVGMPCVEFQCLLILCSLLTFPGMIHSLSAVDMETRASGNKCLSLFSIILKVHILDRLSLAGGANADNLMKSS